MPRRNEPTERRCIVTREVKPVEELIRFVADPEGHLVADLRHRLPGRGVWVTAAAGMVAEAEKRKLFAKALKAAVTVEPGLAGRVAERLEAGALAALGLARKAGALVTGFAKVEAAIGSGKAIAVVHAGDAAEDGVRKLDQAIRRRGDARPIAVRRMFDAERLSLALGGPNVIHAALLAGRPGEEALQRMDAVFRFNGGDGATISASQGSAGPEARESAGQ